MGKFQRHLSVLLKKNALLKRRHPCSTICELVLAIGATALLVVVRHLVGDKGIVTVDPKVHVSEAMPVQLPECAELLPVCKVELVKMDDPNDKDDAGKEDIQNSGPCLEGLTYGCADEFTVWTSGGCRGTFTIVGKEDSELHCASSAKKKKHKWCSLPGHEHMMHSHSGPGPMPFLPGNMFSTEGLHRFQAGFAVAPIETGEQFKAWLKHRKHPWAESIHVFNSSEQIQKHIASKDYPVRDMVQNRTSLLCGALVFETPPSSYDVKYTLRFNATLDADPRLPQIARLFKPKIDTDELISFKVNPLDYNAVGITWYSQSGFLSIQRAVDAFILDDAIASSSGDTKRRLEEMPEVLGLLSRFMNDGWPRMIVPFPTIGYTRDRFMQVIPNSLAFFLLVSLSYSVNRMITSVVQEREARLRDGMRMMGMHPAAFHTSWILTYLTIYLIVTLTVSGLLSMGRVLPSSSSSLIFVWLFLFSTAAVSYGLVITTFFNGAKSAATIGSIVFFASSYAVHLVQPSSSLEFQRWLSLLPPVCFELGAQVFANLESMQIGVDWSNWDLPFRQFSIRDCCAMLLLDSIVYLLLFLYLDAVIPRDTGLQLPWYFPVSKSYWQGFFAPAIQSAREVAIATQAEASANVEQTALIEREVGEAAQMMVRSGQTVELRKLTKAYGDFLAVCSLDLTMYQGEIFALLGHNGAGKTTTLGMLCGLLKPTRGSTQIFGHNLSEEFTVVQTMLGVCPQHDVLWDELTVADHMRLFAAFRGISRNQSKSAIEMMIRTVGLQDKANVRVKHLSGGMKRKLSLGIAFVGDSRLVILDEPTSGLDPFSRRGVWELLTSQKPGRVTVLSTHYMDEADILGDRIAILHRGKLQCCGSSTFLKRAYGCGYNITVVKKTGCDIDAVQELLCSHLPELASEVSILSDAGSEVILQFPFAAAKHFPTMLEGLETKMKDLHVESYGVSVTQLEEVFLKVASGEYGTSSQQRKSSQDEYVAMLTDTEDNPQVSVEMHPMETRRVRRPGARTSPGVLPDRSGIETFAANYPAMVLKRWRYGLRDRRNVICQLCLPTGLLFLFFALVSNKIFHNPPRLELQATHFNKQCHPGPQNTVPFTYLSNLNPDEVSKILSEGNTFWNGEIQEHKPEPESNLGSVEQKGLEILPDALHGLQDAVKAVMKEQSKNFGRRLKDFEGEEEISEDQSNVQQGVERRISETLAKIWAFGVNLRRIGDHDMQDNGQSTTLPRLLADAAGRLDEPNDGIEMTTDSRDGTDQGTAEARSRPDQRWTPDQVRGWSRDSKRPSRDDDTIRVPGPLAFKNKKKKKKNKKQSHWPVPSRWGDVKRQKQHRYPSDVDDDSVDPACLKCNIQTTCVVNGECVELKEEECMEKINQGQGVMCSANARFRNFMPEACVDIPYWMNMLFISWDEDQDGRLSAEDVQDKLQTFMGSIDQSVPVDQVPGGKQQLDAMASKALFFFLDKDHDGYVDHSEFCEVVGKVTNAAEKYSKMAKHFSWQILNSTSSCARYGGYYAVMTPKEKDKFPVDTMNFAFFVNTSSAHSAPIFQSALSNALFAHLGLAKKVTVSTHPFPHTKDEEHSLEQVAIFLVAMYITFCLSFIPSGIVHFVVKERASGARHLQTVSGARTLSYWLSNFTYDAAFYIVPALSVPVALHAYGFANLISGDCGWAVLATLSAFGPAMFGFTYIFSFLFNDHSKASNAILTLNLFGAVIFSTVLFVLVMINYDPTSEFPTACDTPTQDFPEGKCRVPKVRTAELILGPIFRSIPSVCLYQALFCIACVADLRQVVPESLRAQASSQALKGMKLPKISFSPWAHDWAGLPLQYLVCEAVSFFLLVLIVDFVISSPRIARLVDPACLSRRLKGLFTGTAAGQTARLINSNVNQGALGDEGVQAEVQRLADLQPKDCALHVSQLEKIYQSYTGCVFNSRAKHAVNGISLAVQAGEVFGLLGHNGAGKTSALRCMTGELCCTSGRVCVGGYDIATESRKATRCIGYCPQSDGLLDLLTVRDHLELFARLKGLPVTIATKYIEDFGLQRAGIKRAGQLSGGNKRRLSAAIALIGGPHFVLLDEPSCGLDPAARRALWGVVQSVAKDSSTAVMLTTHSMEEAEALSTRLGIIAKGEMIALGTGQQIKQRHGGAYELCITMQGETEDSLKKALAQMGSGMLRPDTLLDLNSIAPLINQSPTKQTAYHRERCTVRGQLERFGHVQASVFSEWWLQQTKGEAVTQFLLDVFKDRVELKENFGLFWRFQLPRGPIGLPKIFRLLEENHARLGIAEYTLTQATLEQIFNQIAKDADFAAAV